MCLRCLAGFHHLKCIECGHYRLGRATEKCWECLYGRDRVPTFEDFAEALGFAQATSGHVPEIISEEERFFAVQDVLLALLDDDQQEIVYTKLCALYMPLLVEKFLNPPPTRLPSLKEEFENSNVYSEMLWQLSSGPSGKYFAKSMLSPEFANKAALFTQCFAERFVRQAPGLDHDLKFSPRPAFTADPQKCAEYYRGEKTIVRNCEQLHTLLCLQADGAIDLPVTRDMKAQLLPFVEGWDWILRHRNTHHQIEPLLHFLQCGSCPRSQRLRDEMEGLQRCARSGCTAKYNLFQCSRCMTALYCGHRHQLEDWKGTPRKGGYDQSPVIPHRLLCHAAPAGPAELACRAGLEHSMAKQ